jgi:hypothetical protein
VGDEPPLTMATGECRQAGQRAATGDSDRRTLHSLEFWTVAAWTPGSGRLVGGGTAATRSRQPDVSDCSLVAAYLLCLVGERRNAVNPKEPDWPLGLGRLGLCLLPVELFGLFG